jgi:predicted anti-sigma-YlaC factor YlaD
MKDSKFIELLNLYLDQQIEPAEAALLEEEIARHPARRQTYQQYCRMHRACTLMFEQAQPESDVGEKAAMTVAAAEEKIRAFPAPSRSYGWVGYAAGLAAAACVALVLVQRRPAEPAAAPAPAREVIVQITPKPLAPVVPVAAARASGLAAVPVNYQAAGQLTHAARRPSTMLPVAADQQPSLEWMRQVQFTPLASVSATPLLFDQQDSAPETQQVFSSRLPVRSSATSASPKLDLMNLNAEKAAWQFER